MNSKNISDIELRIVALLKDKKKDAISLIYDHYSPALYGVILRIVNTPENAEEVLQNVLLKVWTNSASYDASKGRLFTWLVNIARNSAIDYTRSAKFKAEKKSNPFDVNVYNNNKAFASEDDLKDSGLEKVINNLDIKYQKIIELVYFKQFTQREIVDELNIPLGTVKSRLRIALRELRTALGGDKIGQLLIILIYFT
jgi:RNA polymerase sigma-70 factor (ECF subfamily)